MIVAQLLKNLPALMEYEGSQDPTTDPCPEPDVTYHPFSLREKF